MQLSFNIHETVIGWPATVRAVQNPSHTRLTVRKLSSRGPASDVQAFKPVVWALAKSPETFSSSETKRPVLINYLAGLSFTESDNVNTFYALRGENAFNF